MTLTSNHATGMPAARPKKRIFYLDFIRALSVLIIVLTHFNNPFLANNGYLLTNTPFGIYVGGLGVSVFLIISSAGLTISYKRPINLKRYFKKRFLNIYPMFWIAWIVAFVFFRFIYGTQSIGHGPIETLPLTILGFDGLAALFGMRTMFIVGEWFLGFIIIYYLIFPLLLWAIDRRPAISALAIIAINVGSLYALTHYQHTFEPSAMIPVRLIELAFGIYFAKYVKHVAWYWSIPTVFILLVGAAFPDLQENLTTAIVGPAFFVLLAIIGQQLDNRFVRLPVSLISKYSYAVFLTHHVIILCAFMTVNVPALSQLYKWVLFIGLNLVIFVVSVVLFHVNDYVVKGFSAVFKKLKPSRDAAVPARETVASDDVRSGANAAPASSVANSEGNEADMRPDFANAQERFEWLDQQNLKPVVPKAGFFTGTIASYREIWNHRGLLSLFAKRELKSRYKDSTLGYLWTLVRPLINLLIYYFAIGKVLGAQRAIPDFAIYVFAGLTAWGLFAAIVSGSTSSILANAGIVKKVFLPRELFPLTSTASALVDFVSQMAILLLAATIIRDINLRNFVIYVPISLLVVVVWALAFGLILAALNVYMRDIQYLVEVAIMIGFWLTPSVYSFAMIADWASPIITKLYLLNPATIAVMGFQKGTWAAGEAAIWPSELFDRLAIMLIVGIVVLFIAQRIFAVLQRNFAQEM
ncbi:ABC-type polysaccharide/polyol phosphate export permease [Arcanobacterium pluranimalium]|uniref:acyltransferase family protein n=1 Tax=Arcanobacterium pluranimalium TaxID=108028 RepID=UPI0019574770|nr:acyltransferase family protein [Arcanobacterium pluranimalium]MBM7824875.1 ABC-type polysaccharide/polyol phosphate export permease [Arcanobacterium pluranimalium]